MLRVRPVLATIAPNLPFLETLAAWWLGRASGDPLAVADGLFLVPTRRAARGLADAFLARSGGRPLLLPRIVALGGLASGEPSLALAGALGLAPAVEPAMRLAVLTRFILALGGKDGAPRTADRAWALADELARLLDEASRAGVDLAASLPGAAGGDFAEHWGITLRFLTVVTEQWPRWLASQGLMDVAAREIALLEAQRTAWERAPPVLPVIAAGTTGAIPAVARLLHVVSRAPRGLVVLPGLDLGLAEDVWEALDPAHPQASLRNLLVSLDARRGDVSDWPAFAGESSVPEAVSPGGRVGVWRTALLPASALAAWQGSRVGGGDVEGMLRLSASDEQEEAQAIALALRDALETPGTRAALVTPDRGLAQRVAAELLRFGVVADDSAGEILAETPPAVFLRLLAEAVAEDLRPTKLLALLKHPFAAMGLAPAMCREAARALEIACLRGPRPGPGIAGLWAHGKGDSAFLDRVASCLRPLLDLVAVPERSPAEAMTALLEAAEAMASSDEESGARRLWAGEDGEALASHLSALQEAFGLLPPQDLTRLPALLDAVLAGQAVRSRRALRGREGALHPRIAIWGLLEARLQSADVVVLGGLAEAVWPPATDPGPWMNRAMRAAVGLPSPEERIGLAAHDFVMAACSAPVAILSVSKRRARAPTVPSRWLVRLQALLAASRLELELHSAPDWARAIDRPEGPPCPVPPPSPRPAVALRPRTLSVTEVETWIRDPYAIYAKHVLGLRRLDPIEESADAADYGSIVHDGLARFFAEFAAVWPENAAARLRACMDLALDAKTMRPALSAWWRPRLHRIADWVAKAEPIRRAYFLPTLVATEIKGQWDFEAPAGQFLLRGRADRIDRAFDGSIAILDYKTGTVPSEKDVRRGRSPQLPLEAAMAQRGGFGEALRGKVTNLTYWKISGGHEAGKESRISAKNPEEFSALVDTAGEKFAAIVADFDDASMPYLCRPLPGAAPRFSDYAQLARVAEWAAAGEDEAE